MKNRISYWLTGLTLATLLSLGACSDEFPEPTESELESLKERVVDNQVFVEGGTFMLGDVGDPESGRPWTTLRDNNSPAVEVTLDSYSISKYEVTWGEFVTYLEDQGRLEQYTAEAGYIHARRRPMKATDDPLSPNYHRKPATSPNYQEAEGYCEWLAENTGLRFALPTEAQWEFAARNRGENVPYSTDSGELERDPYLRPSRGHIDLSAPPSGNALAHSSLITERRPVGSYPPTPLGIHDMTGNVAEWTRDWYESDFYENAPRKNPSGPEAPSDSDNPEKVVRDWAGHGENVGGADTVFFRGGVLLMIQGMGSVAWPITLNRLIEWGG